MPEPIVLLEEVSPGAPVMASVEADGHTVYLYLYGGKETPYGVRSLWIANTAPAPEAIDRQRMQEGLAPLMPAKSCAHPAGVRIADLEPLRLVWLEEGTGVALYGPDGLLGILPSAEEKDCPGFSAAATLPTPLAWPLDGAHAAHARQRLGAAEVFWKQWEDGGVWESLQPSLLAPIDAAFGQAGRYFAADNGEWPPRFVTHRTHQGTELLITGGVSIRRQPGLAGVLKDREGPHRIELGMALTGPLPPAEVEKLARYVSGNLQLPWLRNTWLGGGHTLACDAIPASLGGGTKFNAVLLASAVPGAPALHFPDYGGEPVTLLWLLPITDAERERARREGSAAVLEALVKAGQAWPHRDRAPVA